MSQSVVQFLSHGFDRKQCLSASMSHFACEGCYTVKASMVTQTLYKLAFQILLACKSKQGQGQGRCYLLKM